MDNELLIDDIKYFNKESSKSECGDHQVLNCEICIEAMVKCMTVVRAAMAQAGEGER